MPFHKDLGRVLRSGHKSRNLSLTAEVARGRGHTVCTPLVSLGFKIVTRRPDRGYAKSVEVFNADPPQPEDTAKRSILPKRRESKVDSRNSKKRKEIDIVCRRLTRAMEGSTSENSTRVTNEKPKGIHSGVKGKSHSFHEEKGGMRKHRARRKENALCHTGPVGENKTAIGKVRTANSEPSPVQTSDGSLLAPISRSRQRKGKDVLNALGDPAESTKDDGKEALLELGCNTSKTELPHRAEVIPNLRANGNAEGWRDKLEMTTRSGKSLQVTGKRRSEQVPGSDHVNDAMDEAMSSKEFKVSTASSNHTKRRKLSVKVSAVSIPQGGPVTRGKLHRVFTASSAEERVRLTGSAGKAETSHEHTDQRFRHSSATIEAAQTKARGEDVACTVTINGGGKARTELGQAVAMMLRRSKRKKFITNADVSGVISTGNSTPEHSKDDKMPTVDKGKGILHERVQSGGPLQEQEAHALKKKIIDLGSEHLASNAEIKDVGSVAEAQEGLGSNDVPCKVDSRKNCFLVATNPTETGGRQMRPRPLDLEQPLRILIEGRQQDYYDFDGGSFYRMLQQQLELFKASSDQMGSPSVCRGTSETLEKQDGTRQRIVIPSFRLLPEVVEKQRGLRPTYNMPQSYIRAVTSPADGFNSKAEYDMDDEDEEWLNNFNEAMSHSGMASTLSEEQFEQVIDTLENKAADLENLKALEGALGQDPLLPGRLQQTSDDCCICNGGENSSYNMVLKCASCDIYVHQSCYGVQEPEQVKNKIWYCRKCEAVAAGKANFGVRCALCCQQGGALKPATEPFKWVHVVCALYTNETFFVNTDAMEPIDGLSAADARARKQRRRCWLCGLREGSVERCSVKMCKALFHVSCGVMQGASFELQHSNQQVVHVRSYCAEHANGAPVSSAIRQKGFASTNEGEKDYRYERLQEVPRKAAEFEKISRSTEEREKRGERKSGRKVRAPREDSFVHEGCHSAKNTTGFSGDDCKCIALRHRMVAPDCAKQRYLDGKSQESNLVSEVCLENNLADVKTKDDSGPALNLHDALKIDIAAPQVVEAVYMYWVSKRAKSGGALLQRIQQEQALKKFDIFNPNATNGISALPLIQGSTLGHHGLDFEMKERLLAARQHLEKLLELTNLIVQREKLKLDIFSLDQDVKKVSLYALRTRATGHACIVCKGTCLLQRCTMCNRDFCFQCFQSKKGYEIRSWLAALELPQFVCDDCQKEQHREEIVSHVMDRDCRNCQSGNKHKSLRNKRPDCEGGCVAGCGLRGEAPFQGNHEKAIRTSGSSMTHSPKQPRILFPPLYSNGQDNSATEVFWESVHHQKTILVSELLKNMPKMPEAANKHRDFSCNLADTRKFVNCTSVL